jgi:hypothetical protein
LYRACDALAVLWPENKGAEDQEVQRALQEFQSFSGVLGRHITRIVFPSGKMST